MKLYIKEKVFTFGDQFSVMDAAGQEKYFVQGEVFSWGKKLHVYDRAGRELAFIKQELFNFLPNYEVRIGGQFAARVQGIFTLFSSKYYIAGPGWDVTGHFMEHDYIITKGNSTIVTIEKEWMTWGDSYVLDIYHPEDELLALAVVLTIDCVTENRKR